MNFVKLALVFAIVMSGWGLLNSALNLAGLSGEGYGSGFLALASNIAGVVVTGLAVLLLRWVVSYFSDKAKND